MAAITVTAANLRELDAVEGRRISIKADTGVTVTKGQAVYRKTNGRAGLARANAVGTSKVVGIATGNAAAGDTFEALFWGRLVGLDLSALDPGTTIYLDETTAGALDGTATTGTGNVAVPVGTVHVMTDVSGTKYLFVDIPQNAVPVALA